MASNSRETHCIQTVEGVACGRPTALNSRNCKDHQYNSISTTPVEKRWEAVRLFEEGHARKKIAAITGIHEKKVSRFIRAAHDLYNVKPSDTFTSLFREAIKAVDQDSEDVFLPVLIYN